MCKQERKDSKDGKESKEKVEGDVKNDVRDWIGLNWS